MKKSKGRLDQALVDRGLCATKSRAAAMILAGKVWINDEPAKKAGQPIHEEDQIRVAEPDHPYVSRGALKLKAALEKFEVSTNERVGLDVGSSTGGFTEILLERGASKVFAIDAGTNQLAWKIRQDPRVVVKEKTNARNLKFEDLGQVVDIIVVDVSFISLDKIFPALGQFSTHTTDIITLIKPQFEVGRENVGAGGIVRDESARTDCVDRITRFAESVGFHRKGLIESPLKGTDGNVEFLAHWKTTKID